MFVNFWKFSDGDTFKNLQTLSTTFKHFRTLINTYKHFQQLTIFTILFSAIKKNHASFVFLSFFELQGSHRAETLTADRSRAPRHIVPCMLGASAAKQIQNNFVELKYTKNCLIIFGHRRYFESEALCGQPQRILSSLHLSSTYDVR